MNNGVILCCLVLAGFTGCMSTREIWSEAPADAAAALNKLQGKEVDITLTNGTLHEDVIFSYFGDTVSFKSSSDGIPRSIPLRSVAAITRPGSALGPILGGLGGLLAGGAIGSCLAVNEHNSTKESSFGGQLGSALTAPLAAGAGAVVGGLVGGTVGLAFGAILGSGSRYVLDPGPDARSTNGKGDRCIAVSVTAAGDSTLLGPASLIDNSAGKITVFWRGKRIAIDKPTASVVRKGRDILVIAPANVWE